MSSHSGDYGKVSIGSDEVAEVKRWRVDFWGNEWAGSLSVAREYAQAMGDAFNSNSLATLTLYLGEDDSEEPYLMGDAVILSSGTISIQFQGTGPLYLVEHGEPQML